MVSMIVELRVIIELLFYYLLFEQCPMQFLQALQPTNSYFLQVHCNWICKNCTVEPFWSSLPDIWNDCRELDRTVAYNLEKMAKNRLSEYFFLNQCNL